MFFKFLKPAPGVYDHAVDEREHSIEEWKRLIFDEGKYLNQLTSLYVKNSLKVENCSFKITPFNEIVDLNY